jgi:(p)ppGpp synthase/HD superfamily hydrolase
MNGTLLIDKFLNKISTYSKSKKKSIDMNAVRLALEYIIKYHGNQKRHSGEPYYNHPIEVAYITIDYFFDTEAIIAALLHDIIEDTSVSLNHLKFLFGKEVTSLVDKLTKLDGELVKFKLSSTESSYKLMQMHEDNKKAITIKLIDRLHNMRTIKHHKSIKKQERIALETLQVFVPMAAYVGIKEIELELHKISSKVLAGYANSISKE